MGAFQPNSSLTDGKDYVFKRFGLSVDVWGIVFYEGVLEGGDSKMQLNLAHKSRPPSNQKAKRRRDLGDSMSCNLGKAIFEWEILALHIRH